MLPQINCNAPFSGSEFWVVKHFISKWDSHDPLEMFVINYYMHRFVLRTHLYGTHYAREGTLIFVGKLPLQEILGSPFSAPPSYRIRFLLFHLHGLRIKINRKQWEMNM